MNIPKGILVTVNSRVKGTATSGHLFTRRGGKKFEDDLLAILFSMIPGVTGDDQRNALGRRAILVGGKAFKSPGEEMAKDRKHRVYLAPGNEAKSMGLSTMHTPELSRQAGKITDGIKFSHLGTLLEDGEEQRAVAKGIRSVDKARWILRSDENLLLNSSPGVGKEFTIDENINPVVVSAEGIGSHAGQSHKHSIFNDNILSKEPGRLFQSTTNEFFSTGEQLPSSIAKFGMKGLRGRLETRVENQRNPVHDTALPADKSPGSVDSYGSKQGGILKRQIFMDDGNGGRLFSQKVAGRKLSRKKFGKVSDTVSIPQTSSHGIKEAFSAKGKHHGFSVTQSVLSQLETGTVEHVKVLTLNGTNYGEVRLRLYPPELGEVRVKVELKGKKVKASFIVDNHRVKAIIDSNVSRLTEAFARDGYSLENMNVSVGEGGAERSFDEEYGEYFNPELDAPTKSGSGLRFHRIQNHGGIDILV